jgi:hypothetical protein
MKKALLLLLCLQFSSQVFAGYYPESELYNDIKNTGCIKAETRLPTVEQAAKKLRKLKIELQYAKESEQRALDFYTEVHGTERLSSAIGYSSLSILTGLASWGIFIRSGASVTATLDEIMAGFLGISTLSTTGMAFVDSSQRDIEENKEFIINSFEHYNCNLRKSIEILDKIQASIYDELGDSAFRLKNALRFGGKMDKIAKGLYLVALTKSLLLEAEIAKLNQLEVEM